MRRRTWEQEPFEEGDWVLHNGEVAQVLELEFRDDYCPGYPDEPPAQSWFAVSVQFGDGRVEEFDADDLKVLLPDDGCEYGCDESGLLVTLRDGAVSEGPCYCLLWQVTPATTPGTKHDRSDR